jgi:hypothetical protein
LRVRDRTSATHKERDVLVETRSTSVMAATPRSFLSEVKQALVIEGQRNSLDHPGVGLRRYTGAVAEDTPAGEEVDPAEEILAAAVGPAEDISAAAVADAAEAAAAADGDPMSASKKTSYR